MVDQHPSERPLIAPPAPTSSTVQRHRSFAPRALRLAPAYDVVVIGSGLGGMTSANRLARAGHRVLLLEQHSNFGGLATWFKRKHGHVFDISLHGFPVGMIKTCRKYWTEAIARSIVPLRRVRFDNPEFQLDTTYDREDFTRILTREFGVNPATITQFFATLKAMNFYDDQSLSTRALFDRFFPGRPDVHRLLIEPIAYANGSTLDDPAITYGIVFSNFMQRGVYTFQGGTSQLIQAMKAELLRNGVTLQNHARVEAIERGPPVGGRPAVAGVVVNGQRIRAGAVVSNANLMVTLRDLVGWSAFSPEFVESARAVRMNSSSCQVYLGLRKGETIPFVGELLFTSTAPRFDSTALCALNCTSRTYSFYYPETRPGTDRYSVVCSTNANHQDWAQLDRAEYQRQKELLARESIAHLEKYLPGIGPKIEHVEVATPRTFEFFTQHLNGASFGTKFEGLRISQGLPAEVPGLFHAGSVGIIMSGWLGAANYGVIVANEVDRWLHSRGLPALAEVRV